MISLELRDLSKSFGLRDVFTGVNAHVGSGCLVITGRNGSGKSTLLRIIGGLISPTSGEAVLCDESGPIPPEARRDVVGMVAPDLALYEELSALENLRFFARVRGIRKTDGDLRDLLGKLGLAGREDDHLSGYSSGMRQRVKYAFAMMHDPSVLLLDEPSTNLDEAGIAVVTDVIEDYRKRGIVVLATNNPSELGFADQVLGLVA